MTQQYTPVSWQDETTSQQGTLINAERLNQMQTAHHYADGFKEVDAVPTADPGTDYHQVVYCTADSTFYRWDGEAWTADIDDDTKRLLEEHEADHANPHVVTKAQVGLGNCDNTSDLDKPISTAVNIALASKANTADVYDKTDMDALLAGKADYADVYTHDQMDNLLAGKVDKLVSSPAGTYKSVTVNAQGQVTAGTNPTTLAGYGITDAYTKTEADTLLAGKQAVLTFDTAPTADSTNPVTSGGVKTALDAKAPTTALTDGSVTKVGTANVGSDTMPIKLVAGVPTAVGHDLMTLDTAQVVTGSKQLLGAYTFKKFVQTFGGATVGYRKLWTFSGRGVFNMGVHSAIGQIRAVSSSRYIVEFYRSTFDSTDNKQTRIYSTADTTAEMMVVGANINPAEGEGTFAIYGYMVASATAEFMVDTAYNEDGTFKTNFAESNDSTVYSLSDIGAIVPVANPYNLVAALDGYLPMVRTTGNQTVAGIKEFSNATICDHSLIVRSNLSIPVSYRNNNASYSSAAHLTTFVQRDKDDNILYALNYSTYADGHVRVWMNVRKADGNLKEVVLADGSL